MDRSSEIARMMAARADEAGCWSISSDEAARLLGMDRAGFWRVVYAVRDRISFEDAVDGWSQDSVGDLLTVLESLEDGDAEEAFFRSGLFIPFTRGLELMESFLHAARCFAASVPVDVGEFLSMLRHAGSVRKAVGIYLDTHTDAEALIDECAESFRGLHGMPDVGAATARRHLHSLFTRHMIERGSLFAWLEERLRIISADNGWSDPEENQGRSRREAAGGNGGAVAPTPRYAWACRVLGVSAGSATRGELRACYRRLMMRHHPDVDPTGLERCKDINAAYAMLVTAEP